MARSLTARLNGATEVELMQFIWSHQCATSLELTRFIQRTRTLSVSSVYTILTNLIEKGFLTCNRDQLPHHKHTYTATATRRAYLVQVINTVLVAFAATLAERLYVLDSLKTPSVVAQPCQSINGATELQIMQMIWNENYRTGREIIPYFQGRYTHATQTVNIILVRLAKKGLLKRESPTRGLRPFTYTPTVNRSAYLVQEVERILATVEATPAERACLVDALTHP